MSTSGPPAGTVVFGIGSLHSNGDQLKHRLIFVNSGMAMPTLPEAIKAAESHFNMNFAKMHTSLTNPSFIPYAAPDGSVLVEVSDGSGLFACTIALYKIVPLKFIGASTP